MEKIEKNLITSTKGKNLIKAATILEITLEDYHNSRKNHSNRANQTQLIAEKFPNKITENKNETPPKQVSKFILLRPQEIYSMNTKTKSANLTI